MRAQGMSRAQSFALFWKAFGPSPTFEDDKWGRRFLRSAAWRKLRLVVFARDGKRCVHCGATPESGARIRVDHIKPRIYFPQLALDPKNLQVLCDSCNGRKGAR